ncbi:quercetin dioxygenase-like cupin family protein [Pseudorhodoferax soli]|uniref:Quercetin dioxygenase-like cupin family protein n=2 Tax=Pseudorhodoferax soli TaxID=545864 RepID=A0A368XNK5_9BURK|nr:quercetin dioxygenase-like cupin family protein [Pseudorhodoferax soli]
MRAPWLRAITFTAATVGMLTTAVTHAHGAGEKVTPVMRQEIANIPGKSLVALVVDYAPGAGSPSHVHAKSAFIYGYVVSGAIESQVNEGPRQVLRAGDSFYEPPGARHSVSRNASKTRPAKLLAVFVVDSGDTALTTPIQSPTRGSRP